MRAATDLFTQRSESSSQQFAWWDGETRGNWLWGCTMMAFLADQPEHQARVTALLEDLKDTQDVVDVDRCWEQSPGRLRFGATALVPLGCTVLRCASFPLKRKQTCQVGR